MLFDPIQIGWAMPASPHDMPSDRDAAFWRPQPRLVHSVVGGEQLDHLNHNGGIAVRFDSLRRTPIHLAFSGSQSTSLSVWSTQTRTGFLSRPKLATDLVTIRFVASGAMSRNSASGGNEILVRFGQVLFTSFEEMRYEQATANFDALTAAVSRDAVIAACRAMSGSDAAILPRLNHVVEMRSAGLLSLRQTIALLRDRMSQRLEDADLMTPLLQELLVYQIVSAWPAVGTALQRELGGAGRERAVKLAIDYMEAHLRRKIEIAEIAAAAGTSVRALQTAFKSRMGCSPVQHLIARRLDKVHAALQSAEGMTIRQIASDWGFTHMSDFARRYRERFGHTPTEARSHS